MFNFMFNNTQIDDCGYCTANAVKHYLKAGGLDDNGIIFSPDRIRNLCARSVSPFLENFPDAIEISRDAAIEYYNAYMAKE